VRVLLCDHQQKPNTVNSRIAVISSAEVNRCQR